MKNDKPKKKKKEKTILTEEQIKKKKARNSRIVACCFLLLLGVGVAGNWYWENSDISAKVSSISSARDKVLGEATYVMPLQHSPLKKMHIFPLHVLTGKPQGTKALKNFKKLLTQQRTRIRRISPQLTK